MKGSAVGPIGPNVRRNNYDEIDDVSIDVSRLGLLDFELAITPPPGEIFGTIIF